MQYMRGLLEFLSFLSLTNFLESFQRKIAKLS